MAALRHVDVPGYNALLIRRTYRDLALPGAIMDRAHDWLGPTAATWSGEDKCWTFPSSARLTFGFLETERDKYRYQGANYHFFGADEVTQLEESQYRYVRTRLRRDKGHPVKPHSRAASNPGGNGHEWTYARWVNPETARFPFVPAKVTENPHIDQADYIARLQDLDEITRAQLLDGLWVVDQQGLILPFSERHMVAEMPTLDSRWRHVLGVDLGASLQKPTTAFVVAGWHPAVPECVWFLFAEKRAAMTVTDIARRIDEIRRMFNGMDRIVVDQGALGIGYGEEFRRRFAIPAIAAQKRDKAGFLKLFRGAIERDRVQIVRPMCRALIDEAKKARFSSDGFTPVRGFPGHCLDAATYSWRECRAWAARAPVTRLRPGSPEALRAWESQTLKQEREEHARDVRGDEDWFY